MSISELMAAVNSDPAVPVNHLIWLNDYKTYGEYSYVFKDKRILKELYASPIAANDEQIIGEASAFNRSYMSDDDLLRWAKNAYGYDVMPESLFRTFICDDFGSWSDDDLVSILGYHYNDGLNLRLGLHVGDTRTVSLSSMAATDVGETQPEQDVELVIAGFDHDDLDRSINGHTKAAITLAQKTFLVNYGYMNSTGTNAGGWVSTARRKWCYNEYFRALPSTLSSLIKYVRKPTSVGSNTEVIEKAYDNVFLFSEVEIRGVSDNSFDGEGYQYEYYKNMVHTFDQIIWTRSPHKGDSTRFVEVYKNGLSGYNAAHGLEGILTGFCM